MLRLLLIAAPLRTQAVARPRVGGAPLEPALLPPADVNTPSLTRAVLSPNSRASDF